jgi:hypothetical protein
MKSLYLTLILVGGLVLPLHAQEAETPVSPEIQHEKPAVEPEALEQLGENDREYSTPAPDAPTATDKPISVTPVPTTDGTTPAAAKPKPAPKPKSIPSRMGDCSGEVWIAHRFLYKRYAGWGFIKPADDKNWNKAKWVLIEEDPNNGIKIPSRFLDKINADQDFEYRFYGEIMPYKGYEPNYDIFVDVFKLRGFELLGKADPINKYPPAPSGSSSRVGRSSDRGGANNTHRGNR